MCIFVVTPVTLSSKLIGNVVASKHDNAESFSPFPRGVLRKFPIFLADNGSRTPKFVELLEWVSKTDGLRLNNIYS